MTVKYSAGCACDEIRYKCTAEPVMSFNCHCRDRQHATGSAYSTDMLISVSWRLLAGSPKSCEKKADSGNIVSRGFCGNCGSPRFAQESAAPDIIVVTAGSLDDPGRYKPTGDLWTRSAQQLHEFCVQNLRNNPLLRALRAWPSRSWNTGC